MTGGDTVHYTNEELQRQHKPASSLRPTACVGGIVVSIAAFQAVDPGSIPGQRIAFCTANSFCNSWLEQNFCMGLWAAVKDLVSPSGNRTPVFRVTGGDTVHYTNEELQRQHKPASSLRPTACVGGIVVSIAAFQAVDPGSIPGQRIAFCTANSFCNSWLEQNFCMGLWAAVKDLVSPSGNRTPVFRVTGGDTVHYTNEELQRQHKPASSLRPTACVGGIVVSIAAFQAVDSGSIPGQRIAFCTANSFCNSWLEQNFCMGLWAAVKDLVSPSGNRTPVFRVTGGDTVHYTNEELQRQHKSASSLRPTARVGGIVVSIAAFQAVDPGSIPGQRIAFCTANSFCKSWLEQNFCMGLWAAVKDLVSPSENRTPVFRVTGGDTVHYTNEELQRQILPDQRDCSSLQTAFPFSGTASF
ncbi:unnamed protein product [Leuciscus chuanchicus]